MNQCGLCGRDLQDGYLCPGCTLGTAQRLDRMPALWRALESFLFPGGGQSPQYGRTRRVEAPMPVNESVLSLRATGGIVSVLESWRSAMQQDRGWGEPAVEATAGLERRIFLAARGLSQNLEWIQSSWPAAGAFAEELRDVERGVLSIVDPEDPSKRGRRLGACPAVYEDGVQCGSVLRHYPGERSVACRWCGCEYPSDTWLALKTLIDHDLEEAS